MGSYVAVTPRGSEKYQVFFIVGMCLYILVEIVNIYYIVALHIACSNSIIIDIIDVEDNNLKRKTRMKTLNPKDVKKRLLITTTLTCGSLFFFSIIYTVSWVVPLFLTKKEEILFYTILDAVYFGQGPFFYTHMILSLFTKIRRGLLGSTSSEEEEESGNNKKSNSTQMNTSNTMDDNSTDSRKESKNTSDFHSQPNNSMASQTGSLNQSFSME